MLSRPLLYAHRGASYECPENTLVAFERAIELGADALETDVHLSADGQVVVSHDPDGARMCGVNAPFALRSLEEIKRWDAGRGFVDAQGDRPFACRGLTVPTLDELLDTCPNVPINIDLKQHGTAIADAAVNLLRRRGDEHRVTLASFDAGTLRAVRALGYAGPTALAQREVIAMLAVPRLVRRVRPVSGSAAQLPIRVGPVWVGTRWVIRKCHALGLRADFWTVNDPGEAELLLRQGADGIMTDDPRAIAPVFDRLYRDVAAKPRVRRQRPRR